MAIRKILTEPNKILREKSLRFENVNKDIQQLMDDMLETLYFITATLNKLDLKKIRNNILITALPARV